MKNYKYHIGADGMPHVCTANIRECRMGPHFDNYQQAQDSADKINAQRFIENNKHKDNNHKKIEKQKPKNKTITSNKNKYDKVQIVNNFNHKYAVTSRHFNRDHQSRALFIQHLPVGKPVVQFLVQRNKHKSIIEIRDNGIAYIYSEAGRIVITRYPMRGNAIQELYKMTNTRPNYKLVENGNKVNRQFKEFDKKMRHKNVKKDNLVIDTYNKI